MDQPKKIVEVNGRRYDAATGRPLADHDQPASNNKYGHASGHIKPDIGRPRAGLGHLAKQLHATPQRATTLIRKAVTRPQNENSSDDYSGQSIINHQAKNSRFPRAGKIAKSKLISRFAKPVINDLKVPIKHAPLPVQAEPKKSFSPAEAAAQKVSNLEKSPKVADMTMHQAMIAKGQAHLNKPLKKASIHKRTAQKLRISPKTMNIGISAIAAVLLAGYLGYQNAPGIALRIAASRAGITAQLPEYVPAGFSLNGQINYKPGLITINYKSRSDQRSFKISQSRSNWDNQALLDNFIEKDQKLYQILQDSGRTIYIYDGSNATWLDKGIWYQVEGQSSLNSEQLIRLASSI